jgi:hypothetical protein
MSPELSELPSAAKKNPKTFAVLVTLSTEDYKQACAAAKAHNETVEEWIGSLVNTALQP